MRASIDNTQALRFPTGGAPSAADDLVQRLDQLNAIGASLSAERDINRLLEAILTAAKTITRADGGTLYRVTEEKTLRFEIVRTSSLKYYLGGTTGNPVPFYPIQLYKDGRPNQTMVAAQAALTGKTINIADAYTAEGFDFTGTRAFDAKTGYRSKSFLTVPMRNHEGETIGVLQLINAQDPHSGEIVAFSASDQRLAESLASQAAVALSNRMLINQLETLFESFISLINGAIDEKSAYTGGHCQRVPVLTMLLAEAVNETTEGPLADFRMTDKDRYELKIAGLLHDCGKVTTPVHVVDKATKLETIFDRVQLIDTRFEVLKRDLEIESLKRRATMSRMQLADDEARLRDELRRIDEDRKFLHACNIGSERMRDDDIEHVKRIARYRWRDVSGHEADFLTADEVKNLTIRAGTLTDEERKIINHHIVATIKMLEALPWPKHLTNVPEYAGGHHERMDGKGYPRGLTREQMSVQARCMGIADIFEALTAKDRPYKKGKTLSESLEILGRMKQNHHIDPDLFDVFVRRQVYRRYAEMFLDKEQIDDVDESKIPGYRP
ncbi:MAG TPA: HD domain-containing phosphohydrolase [Burkholderiales bacterium]|jgi:HD-GYP domain-containing protein (c-di-GMP phosphodiesterase class II)|nr:HD domain-containing phosphohydrolase [Burkholderiales bacterium]